MCAPSLGHLVDLVDMLAGDIVQTVKVIPVRGMIFMLLLG